MRAQSPVATASRGATQEPPTQATFCNARTAVDRQMAEDMVDVLAALHARFYGNGELATQYRWVASYPRWFTIGAEKMSLEYYTRKAFDAAAHVIPKSVLAQRIES